MKVTPLELKKAEFKRVLRGFNPDEVSDLLAAAAETLEEMVRENRSLKDKLVHLGERLKTYESMEKTLNETLITAQKAGDSTRRAAERESELIVAKAEVQAEKLVEEAKSELKRIKYQIEMQEHEKKAFMVKMRSLVASQWKLLQEDFGPRKVEDKDSAGVIESAAEQASQPLEDTPGEQLSAADSEAVLDDAEAEGEETAGPEEPEKDVGDLSGKLSAILGSSGGGESEDGVEGEKEDEADRFNLGADGGELEPDAESGGDDLTQEAGKKDKPEVFWGDDEPEETDSEDKE
ncbi:MAG: DivIVA domain-containing protein [Candidatus Glassbacteria bacterium]|nr:DivIVA domain-containing protein [Candidatus Glassbacteria bacterium]